MLNFDKINIHICPNEGIGPHTHDFFELTYVIKGSAIHSLNGTETLICKGDYFIVDHNVEHSYTKSGSEDFAVINCLFVSELIDKSLKNCTNFNDIVNNYMIKYNYSTANISPANYIFHDEIGQVLALLENMISEYNEKNSGYLEIMRCKLIEIIILSMRKNTSPLPSDYDEICKFILEYTAENIAQKNILGSISKKVNFSIPYLSRRFKTSIGISFSEYLKKLRIEQSCQLLANTNKSVAEIAELVGYSDLKFFNSIFKEHLGITPREFRKYV